VIWYCLCFQHRVDADPVASNHAHHADRGMEEIMKKLLLLGASALLLACLAADEASAQRGMIAGSRDPGWAGRAVVVRRAGWAGRGVVWGGGSRQGWGWGWGFGWAVPGSNGIMPATTYYEGH